MKTPAANNLVLGSSFGIVLGAPILILVGLASRSMAMAALCMGICAVYYCAMVAIILFAGRKKA
jgi:ESS family glutamate:Na+ symporter